MNESVSWDPSLIKKFSSSNHYKLLNQLKNEVKKYPLNNKKKESSIQSKDNNQDIKNKSHNPHPSNIPLSDNSCHSNEENINKSTVSFNNSKNFSIYNNNIISRQNEFSFSDKSKSNDDASSPNFKDRLNEIDLK